MKKIYTLAATMLAFSFFINRASAQTYTGGTYTAVRNGNWHTPSGPNAWDPSGEPPASCNTCLIILNEGITITLNANVNLSGNSVLQIGSGNSTQTKLVIPQSAGADFASSYNIILAYDGITPGSKVTLPYTSALIDAIAAGKFDGILGSYGGYLKLLGNAPGSFFANGSVQFMNPAIYGTSMTGVATLGGSGILPIILLDFNAVMSKNTVNLSWTTVMEANSDHFAVQRSTNGGTKWLTIGTVPAKGSSTVTVNYSYTDETPATGVSQYRLQSFDKDGKYTFSAVKVVRTGLITGVSVFPNPAKDYVNVSLGGDASANLSFTLRLVSQSGQVLVEKQLNNAAGTTVSLPVNNYPQGNYLIMVSGADGSKQTSMVFISRQ